MIRFLIGVVVGGAVVYWYLTGVVPWSREIEAWFSRTASSYTAEKQRADADRLIGRSEGARPSR